MSKQWRARLDAALCSGLSGSALFVFVPKEKTIDLYGKNAYVNTDKFKS